MGTNPTSQTTENTRTQADRVFSRPVYSTALPPLRQFRS